MRLAAATAAKAAMRRGVAVATRSTATLCATASPAASATLGRSIAELNAVGHGSMAKGAMQRGFAAAAAAAAKEEPITMKVPSMGDSISEGAVLEWVKAPGDWVDVDDVLVSIETDKVSVDIRAEVSGVLEEHLAAEGDQVEVGAPLVKIRPGERPAGASVEAEEKPKHQPEQPIEPMPQQNQRAQMPSPGESAPSQAPNVEAQRQQQGAAPKAEAAPAAPAPSQSPSSSDSTEQVSGSRSEKRVKMSRMRTRIAQRLKDAQNVNAMLTTFQEVDMSNLMAMRKRYKDDFEKKHGVRLGFMSAFIKAAASSLSEMPVVNAVIDGGDIVYRDYVDVSVAVASPRGLVVPVIRNAEGMTFARVEQTLSGLAEKARKDAISLEDMAGGTFTISNGGVFGSMLGTPIINPPQSAILGMHATKMRPVAIDGKVEIRPVMYLALTYDHRLIDGREAVTFLCSVRDKIEDPNRFLLEV